MEKIVFLDRDGVINVDLIGDYIKTWDEFRFEAGALEALRSLNDRGFKIVIISNQAGVGDGIFTEDALWEIHRRMVEELRENGITVSGTYYCLHGKDEGCKCRKPETGLFEQAVKDFKFDPRKTFFIGDKASDIEAGKRFGLRTIFVRTGHGKTNEALLKGDLIPDFIADHIGEAAGMIGS